MQSGNYLTLIHKLDAFTRRFYLNKLIKGSLITASFILAVFLVYALLEHQFYFSSFTRKILLFSFIGSTLASLGLLVVYPLAQFYRLGKVISHEQAARIIGSHFGHIQDKLLNILQLKHQADHANGNAELLFAGIEQKTKEIELVPFKAAIDLSKNRKYLRYALPPALILLTLLVAAPSIIRDSTDRLIHTNKVYERDAPFQFIMNAEEDLTVLQ